MPIDPKAQRIIDACESEYDANKSDCNKFVRAVGADIGVPIVAGNADAIVDNLTTNWTSIADGTAAKEKADGGNFVIAGLKGKDHNPSRKNGHVAVVVSGPLDTTYNMYPTGYWGMLGVAEPEYGKKDTLNYAWKAVDVDNVKYFFKSF